MLGAAWPGAGPAWLPFLTGGGVPADVLSLDLEVLQTEKNHIRDGCDVPCPAQLHLLHYKPCCGADIREQFSWKALSSPGTQGSGGVPVPEELQKHVDVALEDTVQW